jgi:hypothetical protein
MRWIVRHGVKGDHKQRPGAQVLNGMPYSRRDGEAERVRGEFLFFVK